jgi:hypothetical protein
MQRYDFHFLQKVTEAELDAAFEACEQAEQRTYTDLGMIGVLIGASVDEAAVPNLTVDVSAGVVVDQTGQRIRWSAIQNVDCSVDENSASTAVTTPGNSKILSVFAKFLRVNSDPRVDGEQATVFFNRAESFELRVAQGAEGVTPSPVALRSDQILLADITITFGQTAIVNANIDMVTRREWAITASSGSTTVARGQVEDAIQDLADAITAGGSDLTAHKASVTPGAEHNAIAVAYAGSGNWADGNPLAATNVEAAVDEIVSDLADLTGDGGAGRVGMGAIDTAFTDVGSLDLPAAPLDNTIKSIYAQLVQFMLIYYMSSMFNWRTYDEQAGSGADIKGGAFDPDNTYTVFIRDTGADADALVAPSGGWNVISPANFTGDDLQLSNDILYNTSGNQFIVVGEVKAPATGAGVQTSGDGGITWVERALPSPWNGAGAELLALTGTGSTTLAVGVDDTAAGRGAYSINGGDSWTETPAMPSTCTSLRSCANKGSVWVAVGENAGVGKIYRISGSPGGTWTDVTPGTPIAQCNSITYDEEHDCFIVVTNDEILYSDNDGVSWTDVTPAGDTSSKRGVAAIPDTGFGIWVVSNNLGVIYVTFDKGQNWYKQAPNCDQTTGAQGSPGTTMDYGHPMRFLGGAMCIFSGSEDMFATKIRLPDLIVTP